MDRTELVRRIATESGISHAELARMSEMSRSAMLAWLAGRRVPRRQSLDQLAAGLEGRARALLALAADARKAARMRSGDWEAA